MTPELERGAHASGRARVFFALWPDGATADALNRLSGSAQAMRKGRRMRRDTLHLTLAFIGDVPRERVADLIAVGDGVAEAAKTPFVLALDRVSSWRHNRITWVGPSNSPAALVSLVTGLNAALRAAGFPVEERRFNAHVTLLRNCAELGEAECIDPPLVWPVRSFALMESVRRAEGANYVALRSWMTGTP